MNYIREKCVVFIILCYQIEWKFDSVGLLKRGSLQLIRGLVDNNAK